MCIKYSEQWRGSISNWGVGKDAKWKKETSAGGQEKRKGQIDRDSIYAETSETQRKRYRDGK